MYAMASTARLIVGSACIQGDMPKELDVRHALQGRPAGQHRLSGMPFLN